MKTSLLLSRPSSELTRTNWSSGFLSSVHHWPIRFNQNWVPRNLNKLRVGHTACILICHQPFNPALQWKAYIYLLSHSQWFLYSEITRIREFLMDKYLLVHFWSTSFLPNLKMDHNFWSKKTIRKWVQTNWITQAAGPKTIVSRTAFEPEVNFWSSTPVGPLNQSIDRFWNDFGRKVLGKKNIVILMGIIKISYKTFINSALPL